MLTGTKSTNSAMYMRIMNPDKPGADPDEPDIRAGAMLPDEYSCKLSLSAASIHLKPFVHCMYRDTMQQE